MKLDINPQFKKALQGMRATKNLFITGKAGTGKSTLLEYFCSITDKKPVILAPTGVAALNIKGQTIHNFFKFYIDVHVEKIKKSKKKPKDPSIYKNLKTLIIDEVSMVRADLLDCVDIFLRRYGPQKTKPFGGVQMIFIGDLYQLPPVVTAKEKEVFSSQYESPFFFSAKALHKFKMEIIELEKVYRQKDQKFIELLNRVRNNSVQQYDIDYLNRRFLPSFKPEKNQFYISLNAINKTADKINEERLKKLRGEVFQSSAIISGPVGKEYFPTHELLKFKKGAQVMLLNNDSRKRWVNGSVGRIVGIEDRVDTENSVDIENRVDTENSVDIENRVDTENSVDIENHLDIEDRANVEDRKEYFVRVQLYPENKIVSVFPHTWEIYQFSFSEKKKAITSDLVGTFTQFPFRLAWAITIHKSQGKTFERVIIDMSRGMFASGQAYVALSRCVSFKGLVLKVPIQKQHIRVDYRIMKFLTQWQYRQAEREMSVQDKMILIQKAIESKKQLKIRYLKTNDLKSFFVVEPLECGWQTYKGTKYQGMRAFCLNMQDERMFRIDRILKLKVC